MSDRQWHFLMASGYKAMFISPEVKDLVVPSVKASSEEVYAEEAAERAFVDCPGMCLMNRQLWEVELDGLKIAIPATDVMDFLRQMRELREDPKFVNRGWYNVYGWRQVISLSKAQYEGLISLMERDLADIRRRADEDDDKLRQGIQRANEELAAKGVPVQVVSPRLVKDPIDGDWN